MSISMTEGKVIPPVSAARRWSGWILTTLAVLFLLLDGVVKIIQIEPVVKASEELGIPLAVIPILGMVLVACTLLYAIPWTSILGAVLLTGYLGGAIATHVITQGPAFSMIFPILIGAIVWSGILLRDRRLGMLFPIRMN